MTKLYIYDIHIDSIYMCDYLTVRILNIQTPININLVLAEIYKFRNTIFRL
jgi:hypothetical protein